jgi:hypothetical protein
LSSLGSHDPYKRPASPATHWRPSGSSYTSRITPSKQVTRPMWRAPPGMLPLMGHRAVLPKNEERRTRRRSREPPQRGAAEQHKADAPCGARSSAASADTSAWRRRVAVFSRSSSDSRESSSCRRPMSGRRMVVRFSSLWGTPAQHAAGPNGCSLTVPGAVGQQNPWAGAPTWRANERGPRHDTDAARLTPAPAWGGMAGGSSQAMVG